MQNSDFTTYDFSSQGSGTGLFSQVQILTPVLLGLFMGPGVASGFRSAGVASLPDRAETEINAPVTVPAGELVATIREGWKLNMTELAGVLGVSRPTLYNWLKGGPVADSGALQHLQVLAAAAGAWKRHTEQGGQDFLLDYTGPQANEESIRQAMGRSEVRTSEITDLIHSRSKQYQEAYVLSREILGEPTPIQGDPIHESTRKLNKRWTENAQRLHRARNSPD